MDPWLYLSECVRVSSHVSYWYALHCLSATNGSDLDQYIMKQLIFFPCRSCKTLGRQASIITVCTYVHAYMHVHAARPIEWLTLNEVWSSTDQWMKGRNSCQLQTRSCGGQTEKGLSAVPFLFSPVFLQQRLGQHRHDPKGTHLGREWSYGSEWLIKYHYKDWIYNYRASKITKKGLSEMRNIN